LSGTLTETRVPTTALFWKTPLSQIVFEISTPGTARIDSLLLVRMRAERTT
jgi:hypothetical protein